MSYRSLLPFLLIILCAGCGIQVNEVGITPTLQIITTTLRPLETPRSTETPVSFPATQLPTVTPVEGITSTQLNVRAEPSTASAVLGVIPANAKVQIVGMDPGESWWQILYPDAGQANEGKGWVTAQYVTTVGRPEVPVIGAAGSNLGNPNAAPAALAIIQQQLNVRSGPGTSFNSLGTLNPQDVVALTGKDANGAWLQIEYSTGPDGRGWINAAFAQAQGVERLPIVTDAGQVIGTATPVDTPLPPTATVLPAPNDNDSARAPAVNVTFAATGTHSLHFTSDVSSPTGDSEDWIQFTPFTQKVILELTCAGNGLLTLELLQNNQPFMDGNPIACGESRMITTQAGMAYQIHFQANASEQLNYTRFTVKVASLP
ncbi:MAG TPA: SH3 domain-containing protein [Anaerolineales bacterium]|nr:SH3 domain-containing protein [Anaerolineales bacterium]